MVCTSACIELFSSGLARRMTMSASMVATICRQIAELDTGSPPSEGSNHPAKSRERYRAESALSVQAVPSAEVVSLLASGCPPVMVQALAPTYFFEASVVPPAVGAPRRLVSVFRHH